MNTDLISWMVAVAIFALAMCATPGPNNAMVAASGASFGFRATIPHILGVAVGLAVLLIAVALGGGGFLRRYPIVTDLLKWVGAAYFLWLAVRIATATPSLPGKAVDAPAGGPRTRPMSFARAALFQWVNPGAWVVGLTAVTTYISAGGVFAQTLALAAIFFCVAIPSVAFWTLTGVGAARLFRSTLAMRLFNAAMAALLLASLLPMVRGG